MEGSEKIVLQDKVAKKYIVTSDASRVSDGKWGKVDLNKIDVAKAQSLVKAQFPYLQEKKQVNSSNQD